MSALLAACGGDGNPSSASPAVTPPPPPPSVAIGGDLQSPASLTAADLAKQSAVTQAVTFKSGATTSTHTYTGANLYAVLNSATIETNSAYKNDILNKYVTAVGSDGYMAVFSEGEIDPGFGNNPNIIAYAETINGVSGDLPTGDGPFRVTSPGDVGGGRYVSQLTNVNIRTSDSVRLASYPGGASSALAISGSVKTTPSYDVTALQAAMAAANVSAVDATLSGTTYTGISLWALLNTLVGIDTSSTSAKNPTLGMYAVATGTDGYKTLVSLGEINPGFGNKGTIIVAYATKDPSTNATTALTASSGAFRLVIPNEVKNGRSVSNLATLEVFFAKP